jgi:transcriptional regulator with XRE-family HTH domain
MLSQIESGKATPSLPTLLHIASVLEVPVEFFISESEDIEAFTRGGFASELKRLYSKKRYEDCLFTFERSNRKADDEIALILATCALECGKKHLKNGNLITAQEFFDKCTSFSEMTVYPTSDIKARLLLFSAIAQNVQSPKLEFDETSYMTFADGAIESDLYNYITENHSHNFSNEIMKNHLKAKELMRSFRFSEAMDIMTEIEANRAQRPVDSYMLFNIYCDLEICAKELGDFEDAYKYSSKRISLLSAFKS